MNGVFLDLKTLEDIDLSPLETELTTLKTYLFSSPEQIFNRAKQADVIITNKTVLDGALLKSLPNLKLVCVSATGYNNIDLSAACKLDVAVSNCQNYANWSVAQHTITLILALHNNLIAYTQAVAKGEWSKAQQFALLDYPITEIKGRTLGIIGYGSLGKSVAKLAQSIGMRVIVAQNPRNKEPGQLTLDELLAQADVVSLHCPLNKDTHNLINKDSIKKMKKGAMVINCARGGLVNESDLVQALKSGHLAGAATDVLVNEPPDENDFLLKQNLPNLIITPHNAWGSVVARGNIIKQISENIAAFSQNKRLRRLD